MQLTFLRLKLAGLDIARAKSVHTTERFVCTSSEFFNADAKTRKNFAVNCWLVLKVFPPPNILFCTRREFFNAIVALECPFFAILF